MGNVPNRAERHMQTRVQRQETLSATAHAIQYPIVFNSNSSIKQHVPRIPRASSDYRTAALEESAQKAGDAGAGEFSCARRHGVYILRQ